MKSYFLLLALAIGCSLGGCMKVHDERELLGKYRAELPSGAVELMEILPNGECVQEIRLSDGTTYKARGTWKYFPDSKYIHFRGTRLALSPTRELNPKLAEPPGKEVVANPVSAALGGRVKIMLHEGIDYRKQ